MDTDVSPVVAIGSPPVEIGVSSVPAAHHRWISRYVPAGYDPVASSDGSSRRAADWGSPSTAPPKLSKWMLVALLYAGCIGSGYGFEDSIAAAGPLLTAIFCLVVPWIWSLPTGLAVSELATSVRSNSGVLMWINVSFPPTLSLMNIIASVFIVFVGNATYPNLAAEYAIKILPSSASTTLEVLVKLTLVLLCAAANVTGVEVVGKASLILSLFTAMPFLIFSLQWIAFHGISLGAIMHVPAEVNWATFLSIASWNYSNLENVGSVVEDVVNPRVNIPGAMLPLVLSTYVSYLLPTMAGVSALGPNQDFYLWRSGYWPTVANVISGPWLQNYLLLGAIVTSFGYTVTGICCSSNMLAGLGQMDVLPRPIGLWLSRTHPRFGTHVNSILLNTAVTILFSLTLSFGEVVALSQSIYCLRLCLVFAAVVRLRRQHPTLRRPYAIPLRRTSSLVVALAAPFLVSLVIAVASAHHSSVVSISLVVFLVLTACVSTFCVRRYFPYGFGGSIQYECDGLIVEASSGASSAPGSGGVPSSPAGSMIDINSGVDEDDTGDDPNEVLPGMVLAVPVSDAEHGTAGGGTASSSSSSGELLRFRSRGGGAGARM
jgi:polyamine:H+ symporter